MAVEILEVCIPTYNGEKTIRASILSLIDFFQSDVIKIKVYDNCSVDTTCKIVGELAEEFPQIELAKARENLGFDGNIERCIRGAESDYVWLFSDDDLAPLVGFDGLYETLRKIKPSIIYLNHFQFDDETKNRISSNKFPSKLVKFNLGKEYFRSCDLGFLSSLILRRDQADCFLRSIVPHSGQAHLALASRISMLKEGPFVLMGEVVVGARSLPIPRYHGVEDGFVKKAEFFVTLKSDETINDAELAMFIRDLLGPYFIYTLLKDRAYKISSAGKLKELLERLSWAKKFTPRFFKLGSVAIRTPSSLARMVLFLYAWQKTCRAWLQEKRL